ncbi:MAG: Hsp20/alpha crystallin family protein [Burkholderiaceae bacterium]|nr:Hsp20/alpha crystallin family protein [Burkholderiaceae bacterium]
MNIPATTSSTRPETPPEAALLPPVDVIEDATGITLYADLPGVPRDQVSLRVDGDQLTLEGQMVLPDPQGLTPHHAEVGLNRYRRSFTLSKELDAERVSAEMTHGVLRVRIPKAERAQPRRISVQVG